MNKVDMVDDENCLNWLKWKLENFLLSMSIDGDNTPIIQGSALGALEGDAEWVAAVNEVDGCCDTYSEPPRDVDKPFLDA